MTFLKIMPTCPLTSKNMSFAWSWLVFGLAQLKEKFLDDSARVDFKITLTTVDRYPRQPGRMECNPSWTCMCKRCHTFSHFPKVITFDCRTGRIRLLMASVCVPKKGCQGWNKLEWTQCSGRSLARKLFWWIMKYTCFAKACLLEHVPPNLEKSSAENARKELLLDNGLIARVVGIACSVKPFWSLVQSGQAFRSTSPATERVGATNGRGRNTGRGRSKTPSNTDTSTSFAYDRTQLGRAAAHNEYRCWVR